MAVSRSSLEPESEVRMRSSFLISAPGCMSRCWPVYPIWAMVPPGARLRNPASIGSRVPTISKNTPGHQIERQVTDCPSHRDRPDLLNLRLRITSEPGLGSGQEDLERMDAIRVGGQANDGDDTAPEPVHARICAIIAH